MTYLFTFDASACSGCKTCQEACKDKNRLPVGVLWRRVVEVSGGTWQSTGAAWENTVFAYNLTLACNHCTHPKCAGVCPTDAYSVRLDGIVLIDSSKCMGCGYCGWACPYGAPQYDRTQGVMTKCDFCYDNLDAGMPPSCVAACPLRVLDYGTIEGFTASKENQCLWQLPAAEHPFPLPNYSRTEPHLVIKPHTGMKNPLEKTVSNREEIQPGQPDEKKTGIRSVHELPLVIFTLFTQMAAGMAIFGLLSAPFTAPVLWMIGALLGLGGLISFLHLGRKRNAWRAVTHLKKSWLSREILMALLFSAAWLISAGSGWRDRSSPGPWLMALFALGLVFSMSRVYLLRAVPGWNTWRTPVAFYLSTAILGVLGVRLASPIRGWFLIVVVGLAIEMGLALAGHESIRGAAGRLRLTLLGAGIIGAILAATSAAGTSSKLVLPIFIVALTAEMTGRWQFYTQRVAFPFQSD